MSSPRHTHDPAPRSGCTHVFSPPEARVLLEVGRRELVAILAAVTDELTARHIQPPDSNLPDNAYVDRASSILQSLHFRLWRSPDPDPSQLAPSPSSIIHHPS